MGQRHGLTARMARVRRHVPTSKIEPEQEQTVHPVDEIVKHRNETVNGINLHWVEAGDGPLVVALHGFPEFWYSWRHQIPALVDAGYRVVAPDLRGYNESDKPPGYDAYLGRPLANDVAGLIERCGAQHATVVGHDWGGAVAWMTAMRRPEVVERLVILNAPHPAVMARELRSPGQLLRSSYMGFFQLPIVPERLLSARDFAGLKWVLRGWSDHADAFTEDDLRRYVEAFARPGALTGALAYYRAMGRRLTGTLRQSGAVPPPGGGRTVTAPTLIIWGRNDPVLGPRLADPGLELLPERRVVFVEDAAHFVQSDAPDKVNELLLEFLGE
jgi:epoxide hydrolase 4